jgi:hypothetical protein
MYGDVEYYALRAAEERLAAMRSKHLNARVAHLEMATLYQQRVDAFRRRSLSAQFDVAGAA